MQLLLRLVVCMAATRAPPVIPVLLGGGRQVLLEKAWQTSQTCGAWPERVCVPCPWPGLTSSPWVAGWHRKKWAASRPRGLGLGCGIVPLGRRPPAQGRVKPPSPGDWLRALPPRLPGRAWRLCCRRRPPGTRCPAAWGTALLSPAGLGAGGAVSTVSTRPMGCQAPMGPARDGPGSGEQQLCPSRQPGSRALGDWPCLRTAKGDLWVPGLGWGEPPSRLL